MRKNASDAVESFRGEAAMYIATPYDLRSLTWTAMSPNTMVRPNFKMQSCEWVSLTEWYLQIVKRLATYAGASAELLIKLMKGETPEKWPVRYSVTLFVFYFMHYLFFHCPWIIVLCSHCH